MLEELVDLGTEDLDPEPGKDIGGHQEDDGDEHAIERPLPCAQQEAEPANRQKSHNGEGGRPLDIIHNLIPIC